MLAAALLLLAACSLISDADLASRFDLEGDGVPRPEDCDDTIADDVIPSWYPDADGDGWGIDADVVTQCVQPAGHAALPGDCDDADNDVNPSNAWFDDTDEDGFGNPDTQQFTCAPPAGTVTNNADCDDTRAEASPASPELCEAANADAAGWYGVASIQGPFAVPGAGFIACNTLDTAGYDGEGRSTPPE